MAYVYKITNDVNQKIYVGKTQFSIEKRFGEHCRDSQKQTEEHRPLYAAMRKYGIEHFHIELLEETDSPEERERYWIEELGSFKYGYNATLGGDGKPYIDYDVVIATYQKVQNATEVAKQLNINDSSVRSILKSRNISLRDSSDIMREKYGKITNMYSLSGEYIRSFPSARAAGNYLIENGLTKCKLTTIRQHISEVCRGKRQTAARYKWQYG